MLLLEIFGLYLVTQKFPRKTSDVGAIRRSLEVQAAKRLTLSNSSGSGNIRGTPFSPRS